MSLDTDTSSGTPIDTPGRLARIAETVTPDSSHLADTSSDGDGECIIVCIIRQLVVAKCYWTIRFLSEDSKARSHMDDATADSPRGASNEPKP